MRRWSTYVCLLLVSCSEESLSPAPQVLTLDRAGFAASFDTGAVALTLSRDGEPIVALDGADLVLGTTPSTSPTASYDPWLVLAEPTNPTVPEHTLRQATAARVLEQDATRFAVELTHEGGHKSRLEVSADADGRFRASFVPLDPAGVVYLGLGARVAEDEAFYGLGEHFDDVNQRGKLRAMQLEAANLESGYNEAHVPVPLLLGTRGWGLFVETSRAGVFDVASAEPTRVRALFGFGEQAAEGLTFHLLAAAHPLDLTKLYYDVTGYPRLPAPWALGPLVWRDENDDQAQVEADLDTMRALDLPATGVWVDRPYATGVQTFDFETARFPDPAAMIDKAHDLGFRFGLWQAPYLDEKDPSTSELRAEAAQDGYWPPQTGLNLNGWGRLIDLTNPSAKSWWQEHLGAYVALGVEGFKLDYAEDVVPDIIGARNVYLFADGSDERTMHRGYTLAYHATHAELLPDEGGLLLCRAGKWGSQVYGPIIWPGDLDARMWKHGDLITEDGETFRAVGGLHASMIAGLTLGPSGFPFYGADTGGYRHAPPDLETFRRWFEQTALSSAMQIGTSTNDVAWELGDQELLDSYRTYTRLHLRLFPYLWTLARDIARTGRPLQRPFGLQLPELGLHPSDQYFLGDALLVAPVTEPGATSRSVVFPPGTWIGFWDGIAVEGPTTVVVDAPLGNLPLYLQAGTPLPLLRDTIDTLSPTTQSADLVDSFAERVGPLWLRVAPGPDAEIVLYDGTRVSQASVGQGVSVRLSSGEVFREGAVVEVIGWGPTSPSAISVGGAAPPQLASLDALRAASAGWTFDPVAAGGTIYVTVPQGESEVTLSR